MLAHVRLIATEVTAELATAVIVAAGGGVGGRLGV
jgi:hypothetical protein